MELVDIARGSVNQETFVAKPLGEALCDQMHPGLFGWSSTHGTFSPEKTVTAERSWSSESGTGLLSSSSSCSSCVYVGRRTNTSSSHGGAGGGGGGGGGG